MIRFSLSCILMFSISCVVISQDRPGKTATAKEADVKNPFTSLKLRSIGPALMSGRVVGLAVHPENRAVYYAAVACGGVWKTENAGTSWKPIFDNENSYSIGCITLDPQNPNTVWVGTGENNSQRSVGYGDGVYKSIDAGRTWTNMGLKTSEHIAKIHIDPRDSNVVLVAAQGPLWTSGGDRGLYKTKDGGKTWENILRISENAGITDFVVDPRNPDVIVAASYQRRRHVWTLVNGGPDSAMHRTSDGGKTWTKVRSGLPTSELGRIGLAISPSDPDVLYSTIEAAEKQGGVFRSLDRGITWEKRNSFDEQAQYYAHLVVDPVDKNRIYIMNVLIQVSEDGGKTLRSMTERWKHVDNHSLWIDPKQPNYYLVGCDGGIYESFDRAANWKFISNLPITQFYDVTCEQVDSPFYRVYGGTQDNNTLGGPARTMSVHGITNSDWTVLVGGDGFHCKVDPKDPNIVYAEFQYGGLFRYDWRTSQRVFIQPQPGAGEPSLRWNWDSPLIISPHSHTRIYFAANKLFRSDDQGGSWKVISGDLTRQLDRDQLKVFGKILPPETVSKHVSTSLYGNITALAESPKKEGLIYVGTDDGLIQVTQDGGATWSKLEQFQGVPAMTYVARLAASQHDASTVYAAFDNHKQGDFTPYLLKSTDAGKTWVAVTGDLPVRGSVLAFAEDHVDPKLLFAGTEFGLYFSQDGGQHWHRLKSGLPTIAVRDLCIQQPMNDLLVGTFGRGFYILDDYSPLRTAASELEKPAALLPIRDGFLYMQTTQYGGRGKASLGEDFYTAQNPEFGMTFTYLLKEGTKSIKQLRKDKAKKDDTFYPKMEELRAEEEEEAAAVIITIHDPQGKPIRHINAPAGAGLHRVNWDFRRVAATAPRASSGDEGDESFRGPPGGPLVQPGDYQVSLALKTQGQVKPLIGPTNFKVKYVGAMPLPVDDRNQLESFQQSVIALQKELTAVQGLSSEATTKLEAIKAVLDTFPAASAESRQKVRNILAEHRKMLRLLNGDGFLRSRNENAPTSIAERVGFAAGATRSIIDKPTGTQKEQYEIARKELEAVGKEVRERLQVEVKALETYLEQIGAPWTPGRMK